MNTAASQSATTVHGPHLRLALWLGAAATVATPLLFPYLWVLMPLKLARSPLPWWALMLIQAAQTGVVCVLLGWLGLFLGARNGLDAPWLRAWVYGRRRDPSWRPHWLLAVALGVLASVLVTALSWPFSAHTHDIQLALPTMAWRGALASFYGGIAEEVMCRLFLFSLLVWLLAWFNHRQAQPWMFAAAAMLAALLFGIGHLPAAFAAGLAASLPAILHIVLLNAAAGVVFGGVFCKFGLEHAMLAHFSADLMLHVAGPLIGSI